MSALQQTIQDFSTANSHAVGVHGNSRFGTIIFWKKAVEYGPKWIKCRPQDDLSQISNDLQGLTDIYYTPNEFWHWRQVSQLKSLRAVYVDIDGHQCLDLVLETLSAAMMPTPSFVVYSGVGMHLYWTLSPTPAQALPVWQRVENYLVESLITVGADKRCRDCTRLLRLVGTVNSKNGIKTSAETLSGSVWTLHELANEVLGYREPYKPKNNVVNINVDIKKKVSTVNRKGSIYDWWYLVFRDLMHIIQKKYYNQIPETKRDTLLFLVSVSLSWFCSVDTLKSEILRIGHKITDFSEKEILQMMGSVISRQADSESGKNITWKGKSLDPRYFFKAETLREWVGVDLITEYGDELRALAPTEVIQKRRADRSFARSASHNTGQGYRSENENDRSSARQMVARGTSISKTAKVLGVSRSTVRRWTE